MQQKLPLVYELGKKMGKTIIARAMKENLASIRVMEKVGLKFEKSSGVTMTRTLVVLMYYTKIINYFIILQTKNPKNICKYLFYCFLVYKMNYLIEFQMNFIR